MQPDLVWDFQLPRVHSINTSGHKYGLVYPGLGWVVWRSLDVLPDKLIFRVSYRGGEMPILALNFSRPGAQVLLQYDLFLNLGRNGYTAIQQGSHDITLFLSVGIGAMDAFQLVSDGSDIPVFAWQQTPGQTENWNLCPLSDRLRMKGWQVPAYPRPDHLADVTVRRIVVRNGLSMDIRRPAGRHPGRDGLPRRARGPDVDGAPLPRLPPLTPRFLSRDLEFRGMCGVPRARHAVRHP
ncbi:glutamate decarboxylase [Leifsonia psychrotolerans]|uniref:glutamate decarboxylase n=1 Tax=Glaciibacter psychrotolerans TaxID=670054 RepID=A0A7Z0EG67_9MICO|nr:glutamate decarboxylase [Leifsonia psychrotolerans]